MCLVDSFSTWILPFTPGNLAPANWGIPSHPLELSDWVRDGHVIELGQMRALIPELAQKLPKIFLSPPLEEMR